jgi:cell division septum initiation protein DivIVA
MANDTNAAKAIRKVVGGYEQSEINVYLGRLEREIEDRSSKLQEIKDEVRRTQAQIDLAGKERPSFSELGGAFEEALRMAEDQSAKLVSEALTESTRTIAEASARARALVDAAELKYNSAVNEATTEAQKITLLVEQEVARAKSEVAEILNQLSIERARVEREAGQMVADAERTIAEQAKVASREMEKEKRDAVEAAREAKEYRTRTEFELRQREDDVRNDIRSLELESDAYAKRVFAEADQHTEDSIQSASEISREAEEYVRTARERAEEVVRDAEEKSAHVREDAESAAARISAESAAFVGEFTDTLERRINSAREQMENMSILSHNLKMVVNGFDLGQISTTVKTSAIGETVAAEIVED